MQLILKNEDIRKAIDLFLGSGYEVGEVTMMVGRGRSDSKISVEVTRNITVVKEESTYTQLGEDIQVPIYVEESSNIVNIDIATETEEVSDDVSEERPAYLETDTEGSNTETGNSTLAAKLADKTLTDNVGSTEDTSLDQSPPKSTTRMKNLFKKV